MKPESRLTHTFFKMGGRVVCCGCCPSSAVHNARKLCRGDLGDPLGDLGGVQNSNCCCVASGSGAAVCSSSLSVASVGDLALMFPGDSGAVRTFSTLGGDAGASFGDAGTSLLGNWGDRVRDDNNTGLATGKVCSIASRSVRSCTMSH